MSDLRILIVGPDAAWTHAVRAVVASELPEARCDSAEASALHVRPAASAVVVDARKYSASGMALPSRLRAMGFAGALAVIGESDDALAALARQYGFAVVPPDRLADELVPRLAEQMALASMPHADQVMRARRLMAAGEMAQHLQHSLNNPLTGLLAETQLMQLDDPSEEHAAVLERMVALCRRMNELTRTLDGLGEPAKTS